MKITRLLPVIVKAGDRNWIFVRVETDQPGLYGWGEATLEWKTRAVVGCIEDFAPMLVGENPLDISRLHERMMKHSFWPLGVIGLTAVSAIEHALWDILGKECGKPVWQLLGGKARDRAKVYAHVASGMPEFKRWPLEPAHYAEAAGRLKERGYVAVKTLPVPIMRYSAGLDDLRRAEKLAVALRDAVGDGVDILFDFHGRPATASAAVDFAKAVAACKPMFVEEPIQPGDPESIRLIADRAGVPIATGERLLTLPEFEALARLRAVNYFQPDLCHCGGLTVARQIAAVGASANIGIAPHNPAGPIASAVGLHFAIATPNFAILEQYSDGLDHFSEVVSAPLLLNDGYWEAPTAPGLGVDVDLEAAKKYPFEQEAIPARIAVSSEDGSMTNW